MVIQEGGIKCIKNESKDSHNVTKGSILNQFRSFDLSINKESRKNASLFPQKHYITAFNINNNNKKCLLSSKSEWSLKDHVTLKTENWALP